MRDVSIVGVGRTAVGEHWDRSLRQLAAEATTAALEDARTERVDSLVVASMLAGELCGQRNLGALVAEHAGLRGTEAMRVEAACASGGVALRAGYAAVASGLCEVVVVVGVEKMTDRSGAEVSRSLASAADADFEVEMGLSFAALSALLMRRYMHQHRVSRGAFAPFVINAHRNAQDNPLAMLRVPISAEDFSQARMVADPISILDSAPISDGAAAVVLQASDAARTPAVAIRACCVATDALALHDRRDSLVLDAAMRSCGRAYEVAGVRPEDVDLFEAHDAFSIMTVLALEACGFAGPGRGAQLGAEGAIARDGKLPLSTMGGLKARGHPVGASGVFQIAEVVLQLTGRAGASQLRRGPRLGLAQSIGGSGATVVTTLLEAPA